MTKLIVAFRNFAYAPNVIYICIPIFLTEYRSTRPKTWFGKELRVKDHAYRRMNLVYHA